MLDIFFWVLFGAAALFVLGGVVSMLLDVFRERRPSPRPAPKQPTSPGDGGISQDTTWGIAGISSSDTSTTLSGDSSSSDSSGSDSSGDSGGGSDFSGGGGESGGGGASGGWND